MEKQENVLGQFDGSNIDLSINIDCLISKSINKDNEKDFSVFKSSNHHLLAKSCVKFLKKKSYDISLGDNDMIRIKMNGSDTVRIIRDMILENEVDRSVFGNLPN